VSCNGERADEDDHCEYKTQQFIYLSHTHHCLLLIMGDCGGNTDPETVLKFDKILLPSSLYFMYLCFYVSYCIVVVSNVSTVGWT